MVNWRQIQATLRNTGVIDRLFGSAGSSSPSAEQEQDLERHLTVLTQQNSPSADSSIPAEDAPPVEGQRIAREDAIPAVEAGSPALERDAGGRVSQEYTPIPELASREATPESANTSPASSASSTERVAGRQQPLYFMRLDRDGVIIRTRVTRLMQLTDAPLVDVLQALLRGPNAEEHNQGLISLIPPGTRVLSSQIYGGTAYINFSEDFLFNMYGVEGYAAQLRQIIWTITELPEIQDMQVLIEGRRIDFLGEGIWIGGPINRDSL